MPAYNEHYLHSFSGQVGPENLNQICVTLRHPCLGLFYLRKCRYLQNKAGFMPLTRQLHSDLFR